MVEVGGSYKSSMFSQGYDNTSVKSDKDLANEGIINKKTVNKKPVPGLIPLANDKQSESLLAKRDYEISQQDTYPKLTPLKNIERRTNKLTEQKLGSLPLKKLQAYDQNTAIVTNAYFPTSVDVINRYAAAFQHSIQIMDAGLSENTSNTRFSNDDLANIEPSLELDEGTQSLINRVGLENVINGYDHLELNSSDITRESNIKTIVNHLNSVNCLEEYDKGEQGPDSILHSLIYR